MTSGVGLAKDLSAPPRIVGVFVQSLHDTTIMQAPQNKEMVNYPLFPLSCKFVKDSFLAPKDTIMSNLKTAGVSFNQAVQCYAA